MAHATAVILLVGLNESLLGEAAPNLTSFRDAGHFHHLTPDLPAVTCTVQSSMLTGAPPRDHGIVGNGWYNRPMAEVQFWKQSNRLVHGEKVWETARNRDPTVTCANLFWWYNMYSTVDVSVTPRPMYKADGRKIPDCYAEPPDLRDQLQSELGRFPLFNFWGPAASIKCSEWIASAAERVFERFGPTLSLVYLPHLDYSLQKLGPSHAAIGDEVAEVDRVAGRLIDFYRSRDVRVIVLSEYGIEPVDDAVHLNRVLRDAGRLRVRVEDGRELLDAGASRAFAVADHQVAHVYVREPDRVDAVRDLVQRTDGVERVLDRQAQAQAGIDHPRAGDLVAVAAPRRWFSYYYWMDDARAPDFARTVDIHRKPGYDPVELFLDPAIRMPKLAIASRLLKRRLGMRTLMDVVPIDASLVRGSHGRVDQPDAVRPVLMSQRPIDGAGEPISCRAVRDVILDHLFGD